MAEDKRPFLLYTDLKFVVNKLTNDKAGELFKTILAYVNDEDPVIEDMLIDLVFEPIRQSLKRDLVKYNATKEKRAAAGRQGGIKSGETRSKTEQDEANEANSSHTNQTQTNEAVNDNGNVNDNDNGILLEKESKHSLSNNITLEEKKANFLKKNDRKAAMIGGSDSEAKHGGSNKSDAKPPPSTIAVVLDSPYGTGELHHRVREWARANPGKHEAEVFKDFLGYWTAPVQKGQDRGRELWKTKLTFEIGLRLATWAKNEKQSNQNGNKTNTSPADYLTNTARELEAIFNSPNSSRRPTI